MGFYDDLDLPPNILAMIEFSAVEDVAKAILEPVMAPIPVETAIEVHPPYPYVVVRRMSTDGDWTGDMRGFYDSARLAVHVYADDPNGDAKAALISEAVRKALWQAKTDCWSHPELGALTNIRMTMEPTRRADWATSTGPVQYADLPTGGWRYETHYALTIRPPR